MVIWPRILGRESVVPFTFAAGAGGELELRGWLRLLGGGRLPSDSLRAWVLVRPAAAWGRQSRLACD